MSYEPDSINEPVIMDEEDAHRHNAYREAGEKFLEWDRKIEMARNGFRGNPKLNNVIIQFAKGYTDICGFKDMVEIARHFRCTRANVQKLVKHIQAITDTPPTPGQRSKQGCANMSKRRKEQLEK